MLEFYVKDTGIGIPENIWQQYLRGSARWMENTQESIKEQD